MDTPELAKLRSQNSFRIIKSDERKRWLELGWSRLINRSGWFGAREITENVILHIDLLQARQEGGPTQLHISADSRDGEAAIEAALASVVHEFEARVRQVLPIVQYKSQARQISKELYDRVQQDPHNGQLQWQLARQVTAIDLPQVADDNSNFWQEPAIWYPVTQVIREAHEILELGLALGIPASLDAARAHYLYFFLTLMLQDWPPEGEGEVEVLTFTHIQRNETQLDPLETGYHANRFWHSFLESTPALETHIRAVVDKTQMYLQRDPQYLPALRLQRAAAALLRDRRRVGNLDAAITQVMRMNTAGLVAAVGTDTPGKVTLQARNDGQEFEGVTQRLLSSMGLRMTTTKVSGDGGIDLIAISESPVFAGTYVIQCKDWSTPVGEPIVRDLYGVVTSERANKGILITTGRFTAAAVQFAEGKPLELIDGAMFDQLLRQHGVGWSPSKPEGNLE